MELETTVLRYLLITCMAVSALVFVTMLVPPSTATPLAEGQATAASWASAPTTCAVPDDGVICAQPIGTRTASTQHSR